jgi:putative transcriptional regulator
MQTRIKEYRTSLNLTQEDLAKTFDVRRETIVFLKQGKYKASLKLGHDGVRAFCSTIDDLFIFEEDGPDRKNPFSWIEVPGIVHDMTVSDPEGPRDGTGAAGSE